MTIKEALENRRRCLAYLEGCGPKATPENVEAVRLSVIALEEKLAREEATSEGGDSLCRKNLARSHQRSRP